MPTISTRRMLLRPLAQGDAAALARICGDATTMRCWPAPPVATLGDWLSEESALTRRFAVTLRGDGRLLGEAGTAEAVLDGVASMVISWTIQAPHWERGYAVEAAEAVLQDAFARLGARQLHACLEVDHLAARRVAEQIGMTLLGELAAPAGGVGRCCHYLSAGPLPPP